MRLDFNDRRTILGLSLIAFGLLTLMGQLGVFEGVGRMVGGAVLAVLGALTLRAYNERPGRLWTIPVGAGFIGLALVSLFPELWGWLFLAALASGFLVVFLVDDRHWWAIIPAGVLYTVTVIAALEPLISGREAVEALLLFGGLSLTFASLRVLPNVQQRWAVWPAAGLAFMALLVATVEGAWVVPTALLVAGLALVAASKREADRPGESVAADAGAQAEHTQAAGGLSDQRHAPEEPPQHPDA